MTKYIALFLLTTHYTTITYYYYPVLCKRHARRQTGRRLLKYYILLSHITYYYYYVKGYTDRQTLATDIITTDKCATHTKCRQSQQNNNDVRPQCFRYIESAVC